MKRFIAYVKDSIAEMKKVIWPSRDEVEASTKVVIVSLILFSLLLGAVDLGLAAIVQVLFK